MLACSIPHKQILVSGTIYFILQGHVSSELALLLTGKSHPTLFLSTETITLQDDSGELKIFYKT